MKKRVLISVSDKKNIVDFSRFLEKQNFEIVSTGGTYNHLLENNIKVKSVSEVTGFPEILNGRVKTLHPKILGGILVDKNNPDHLEQIEKLSIKTFDMIIVNLYPFKKTVKNRESSHQLIIENIDIGGPNMVRAAAKNYKNIAVVTDIEDYDLVKRVISDSNEIPLDFKYYLAKKAFAYIADYDVAIARYFCDKNFEYNLPTDQCSSLFISLTDEEKLRYGENPHQSASFYRNTETDQLIEILHGKQLSYNNYLDIDSALKLIIKFTDKPAAAIIKHTNPCGIGQSISLKKAYINALSTDPLSPFGGIVVVNKTLDMETAQSINEIFTEIVIAPDYESDALDFLKKKKNRRLIRFFSNNLDYFSREKSHVSCLNGILSQEIDIGIDNQNNWKIVTQRKPDENELDALIFAWKTVSCLKSNAVCFTDSSKTYGLGIGQTSRVDSTEIAIGKAIKFGHNLADSVCASDGFFPFEDSIELLEKYKVKAVIQPGGSKGDQEVIKACDRAGITMIFTGVRHFRH